MKVLVTGGSGFIGTNYLALLQEASDAEFINVDQRPPRNSTHTPFFRQAGLLDASNLTKIVTEFAPTHVVHLAARTGLHPRLSDYAANMEGVENLLEALAKATSVQRVVFTSSTLVCRLNYFPKTDTDYQPDTLYGQSKVRMEQIIRARNDLPYAWTIIRPVSIWGPWAEDPFTMMFKAVARGWYFHVGHGHYRRTLGYVENAVRQVHKLLVAPAEAVDRKTFYVADEPPVDLYDLATLARQAMGAQRIRRLPVPLARLAATAGDVLTFAGWKGAPITSRRLNNIVTSYVYDVGPIRKIAGPPAFDLAAAVQRTAQWLRETGQIA